MAKNKIKEPKKFNRPRAYLREYFGDDEVEQRIRIIYPDGKSEWASGEYNQYNKTTWSSYYPCWHKNYESYWYDGIGNSPRMSAINAVKEMKRYDKSHGYKTIYLGEF